MKSINFASRPYMYFSEQGNVVDDGATFITILLVSFNLQSCCLMQSAVCSLRSAVCSLQSAVCSLQSAVCGLQSANVIPRYFVAVVGSRKGFYFNSLNLKKLLLLKKINNRGNIIQLQKETAYLPPSCSPLHESGSAKSRRNCFYICR